MLCDRCTVDRGVVEARKLSADPDDTWLVARGVIFGRGEIALDLAAEEEEAM